MRLVIIESPFAALTPEGRARNRRYLDACILDCLRRGEAPFASHALYPGPLDDTKPDERKLGIAAGFAWRRVADATVVYEDLGISNGMRLGVEDAKKLVRHFIEYRRVPGTEW